MNPQQETNRDVPPYDESDLESESKWSGYERKYRAKWLTPPIMHRAETDRNITPTTYQTMGNYESERSASVAHGGSRAVTNMPAVTTSYASEDSDAVASITERVVPAATDTVVINNGAEGIALGYLPEQFASGGKKPWPPAEPAPKNRP